MHTLIAVVALSSAFRPGTGGGEQVKFRHSNIVLRQNLEVEKRQIEKFIAEWDAQKAATKALLAELDARNRIKAQAELRKKAAEEAKKRARDI